MDDKTVVEEECSSYGGVENSAAVAQVRDE